MKTHRVSGLTCMLLFAALLGFSAPAHAYLDPTTGSMVISAIVGIFASIALALKTYWYKIKSFFRRGSKPADGNADPADSASD